MSQSTLGDDDLFGEAAAEMREEIESHLAAARAELPEASAVWETDAENVLGVMNALDQALDAGAAEEHLRQAKKSYVVGDRADAFEDADDLAAEIEELASLVETVAAADDHVGELTGLVPELRGALQEFADEE